MEKYYAEMMDWTAWNVDLNQGRAFWNVGWWGEGASDQSSACAALMQKITAFAPEPRRILDVGCGLGGTTEWLRRRWPAAEIDAINVSSRQLAVCRDRVPDCRFHLMDAVEMDFPVETFDLVVCVEAAMHFRGRRRFLEEARRVMARDGTLHVTDMWYVKTPGETTRETRIGDYERLYHAAGYEHVELEDATEGCWTGFKANLSRWMTEGLLAGRLNASDVEKFWAALRDPVDAYVLVSARKKR